MGLRSCKEMHEAKLVYWWNTEFTADDLALLGTLGSMLPVLEMRTSGNAQQAQPAPTACSGWRRGWARVRCRP